MCSSAKGRGVLVRRLQHYSVNNHTLACEVAGSGPAVVLVHAGIADRRMWQPQVAALESQYTVVRYDLRGYGESAPAEGEFSHVDELYQLLQQLQLGPVVLVGCSKGGIVALDAALAYPSLVCGLGLICSNPSGYQFTSDPPLLWEKLMAAFKAGDLPQAAELEVALWLAGSFRSVDQLDPSLRQLVYDMDLIALQNEAQGLGKELPSEPPAVGRLAEIQVPTLVIAGALDDPELVQVAHLMAQQIPTAELVILEQTAHLPNLEQPAQVNQLLRTLLQRSYPSVEMSM